MSRYVVMGVSGCGKTTVGQALAKRLGIAFLDGDSLHPQANIDKMARGEPLNDADREPWLGSIAERFHAADAPLAIGCSALKRRYRDLIRAGAGGPVTFLHLEGTREVIAARMAEREGHFMPLSLLDSQFAALETPDPDEDAIGVDIDQPLEAIVEALARAVADQQD